MNALVKVELAGPSSMPMFRCFGSITERHGMCVYPETAKTASLDTVRAWVAVPRTQTPREAEKIIAQYVEWIRGNVDSGELEVPRIAVRSSSRRVVTGS